MKSLIYLSIVSDKTNPMSRIDWATTEITRFYPHDAWFVLGRKRKLAISVFSPFSLVYGWSTIGKSPSHPVPCQSVFYSSFCFHFSSLLLPLWSAKYNPFGKRSTTCPPYHRVVEFDQRAKTLLLFPAFVEETGRTTTLWAEWQRIQTTITLLLLLSQVEIGKHLSILLKRRNSKFG